MPRHNFNAKTGEYVGHVETTSSSCLGLPPPQSIASRLVSFEKLVALDWDLILANVKVESHRMMFLKLHGECVSLDISFHYFVYTLLEVSLWKEAWQAHCDRFSTTGCPQVAALLAVLKQGCDRAVAKMSLLKRRIAASYDQLVKIRDEVAVHASTQQEMLEELERHYDSGGGAFAKRLRKMTQYEESLCSLIGDILNGKALRKVVVHQPRNTTPMAQEKPEAQWETTTTTASNTTPISHQGQSPAKRRRVVAEKLEAVAG